MEPDLPRLLGRWFDGRGPLYRQLRDGLLELLETGVLRTGMTLPPERKLAAALSVSRNTVAAAYAELRAMGWADARQGAGTTITALRYSPVGGHRANAIFATMLRNHPDVIDLTIAVPDAAPAVAETFADPSALLDPSALTRGHGYEPRGDPDLRAAIAETLTANGLPTMPDELMITTGAQQAIALTVRGLTRPGDPVVMEEVTFPGAIDAIGERGLRPIPIAVTERGLDVEDLERILSEERPRLAYLVPTFHNPTGSLLEGPSRARLADLIAEHQLTTIDDLTLAELDFGSPAPPPLAALRPDAPIITVGSLSKVFWGGLRIGWLRAGPNVLEHLVGRKTAADLGSPAPMQRLAAVMLARYDETRQWRNEQLATSLARTAKALEAELPDWEWTEPRGGPHLWLRLPGQDASAFAARLLRDGVAVVPGPLLAVRDAAVTDRIRIPFYRSPAELEEAIERMGNVWRGWPTRSGGDQTEGSRPTSPR